MLKYKVTNISHRSVKGERNVFMTEVGRLIKPGEHCVTNRLDNGTRGLAEVGVLKIEEGNFAKPEIFPEELPKASPPKAPEPKAGLGEIPQAATSRKRLAAAVRTPAPEAPVPPAVVKEEAVEEPTTAEAEPSALPEPLPEPETPATEEEPVTVSSPAASSETPQAELSRSRRNKSRRGGRS